MISLLLTMSSLLFAQESYFIYRVDHNNHTAVVTLSNAEEIRVGEEFKIQTPDGYCHTPVTEVINGFFYVNIEQCRNEHVQKGTMLVAANPVAVPMAIPNTAASSPVATRSPASSPFEADSSVSSESNYKNTVFYKQWIANKLSAYVGYHAGNDLDGQLGVTQQSTITGLSGSHTVGFGAEYQVAELPYNFDVLGGLSYNLPRSYGRYSIRTQGNGPAPTFNESPELQLWSFYANLRYRFAKDIYGYFGLNRTAAYMSGLPGDARGDFGFHAGARYYPWNRFFVDGAVNFYNIDYSYQGRTTDVSLTELEIKGGYTF